MDEKSSRDQNPHYQNPKQEQLDQFRVKNTGKPLTTKQNLKVSNYSEILKAEVHICMILYTLSEEQPEIKQNSMGI